MAHEIVTMKFSDTTVWNPSANNGTGAYAARFAVVHPGREQEAESILNAFKSANGKGTRIRDGVVCFTEKQLAENIAKVQNVPGQETTLAEFQRGLESVHRAEAARLAKPAVTATTSAKFAM